MPLVSRRPSPSLRWWPLLGLFAVAACSPARTATRTPEPERRPVAADVRPTETFDPSAYPASVRTDAPAIPEVQHDVPEDLLANRTPSTPTPPPTRPTPPPDRPTTPREPVLRTLNGYRVQIFQSASKDEADRRVADAIAWWRRSTGGTPEVYTVYRAPYYRVRVGNYATRSEADRAARSIGGAFPGSLVVPDRVTVRQ